MDGPERRRILLHLLALTAIFAASFAWVKPTNFAGFDEWLILWLGEHGSLSSPYASRPLVYLWSLPGSLLVPYDVLGYFLVHAFYLVAAGWLVYLLCRRLVPGGERLAFLAGTFTVVWAPLDLSRLTTVQLTLYSGLTVGMYLAVLLLVESWLRRRASLLAAACLVALVVGRSYESPLPLLFCAPLLLLVAGERLTRSFWLWMLPWTATVLFCGGFYLWAFLHPSSALAYQTGVLAPDSNPLAILLRLLGQFDHHLTPLVTVPRARLDQAPVAIAVLVFAGAWLGAAPAGGRLARRTLATWAGVGLTLAALAYSAFVIAAAFAGPHRMQILSAPGIGLFLAAAVLLLASLAPLKARPAVAGLLAAWIVAVGSARTVSMQRVWDATSFYAGQRGSLLQLTELAPGLAPHTLVVLIDDSGAWPASFGFRHAVELLYPGDATGIVYGGYDFLYPTSFDADAVSTQTWPVIQKPWGTPTTTHGYDELLVVYLDPGGRLRIAGIWPGQILPNAAGSGAYAPASRIVRSGTRPPQRDLLDRAP